MANRRILIAGCGYIGKLLARRLLAEQQDVLGLVSSEASAQRCSDIGIPCLSLDFDQFNNVGVERIPVAGSALIYLAPPPAHDQQDTRIGHFLQAIEEQPPSRMVLISTTGVYGDCVGDWVDETTELKPVVGRAQRRADAEYRATQFCQQHDIPLVILRVPGIYGPGKLPLERIKKGLPIVSQQDSPFTNRIHSFDLVSICRQALLDDHLSGIYNCSDGQPGTMYEYFTQLAELAGLAQPPVISLQEAEQTLSVGMMSYMRESRRIDNRKLLKDFGIKLQYPDFRSGLAMCFK